MYRKRNYKKGKLPFLTWLEKLKPEYKKTAREIYTEKHDHPPDKFVEGESKSDSREIGLNYLLTFDKDELIEMKKNNEIL